VSPRDDVGYPQEWLELGVHVSVAQARPSGVSSQGVTDHALILLVLYPGPGVEDESVGLALDEIPDQADQTCSTSRRVVAGEGLRDIQVCRRPGAGHRVRDEPLSPIALPLHVELPLPGHPQRPEVLAEPIEIARCDGHCSEEVVAPAGRLVDEGMSPRDRCGHPASPGTWSSAAGDRNRAGLRTQVCPGVRCVRMRTAGSA
jgi:hypothetical protein